jgi:hypothetical protein
MPSDVTHGNGVAVRPDRPARVKPGVALSSRQALGSRWRTRCKAFDGDASVSRSRQRTTFDRVNTDVLTGTAVPDSIER